MDLLKKVRRYIVRSSIQLKILNVAFFLTVPFVFFSGMASAQTEVMAWGNITGIRVKGQLMEFESSLCVVEKDWKSYNVSAKERQRPTYKRDGLKQIVTTNIDGIGFTQTVEEKEEGSALVSVVATSAKDTILEGVFFCFKLPATYYSEGLVHFSAGSAKSEINLSELGQKDIQVSAKGFKLNGMKRALEVDFNEKTKIVVKRDAESNALIYVELLGSKIKNGQKSAKTLMIKTSGGIDKTPVEIVLDTKNPGRKFAGLGGNFRLQNPTTDPQVIDYCLANLRVDFGRVEMPWSFWHPDENKNPIDEANAGNLNPRVDAAMKMAQRLAAIGMPVIVSDWSAPAWAIQGNPMDAYRFRSQGIYGYPLKKDKTEKIYQSICDYLVYLKDNYGVEAWAFSFNESDLGIDVRHTGEEHAEFIKGLGKHIASRGLATKLLLGDNSDATTFDFILPAMNDPETHKYIAAISFHSWRGCNNETLNKWADAAKKMNVPLIVGEGSTDAAAWNYPDIFSEQTFALYEINLYTRLCAICQPLSILQWQLTADYSVLIGAGVFKTEGPLRPTQRFWNLKQLASTPENAFAIPFSCTKEEISAAAFGNIARGEYAIHIVNNGAECEATILGIPSGIREFKMYVTNGEQGMNELSPVLVNNGKITFNLSAAGFTTLINTQ